MRQVLATSEIPSLLFTDDVGLASSNSYLQLTRGRGSAFEWEASGMPSVSSKREARSAEAVLMEMPLQPAAAQRDLSRDEKLSIYLSATVMSQG